MPFGYNPLMFLGQPNILPQPQVQAPTPQSILSRYRNLTAPENNPATSRLYSMMQNPPTRDQYKVGTGGRIAAALSAGLTGLGAGPVAGFAAGREILDRPYNNAMQDYSTQYETASKLSDIERFRQQNDLAGLRMEQEDDQFNTNYGLSRDRLNEEAKQHEATNAHEAQRIELERKRLEEADWIVKTDPVTGIDYRENVKTGEKRMLNQSALSLEQKKKYDDDRSKRDADEQLRVVKAQEEAKMREIAETARVGTERDAARIKAHKDAAVAKLSADQRLTPQQEAYQKYVIDLGQLLAEDPELADYVKQDPTTGLYTASEPKGFFSKTDPEKLKKMREFFAAPASRTTKSGNPIPPVAAHTPTVTSPLPVGAVNAPNPTVNAPTATPAPAQPAKAGEEQKVEMEVTDKATGKKRIYMIPLSQVPAAEANGAKRTGR